MTIAQALLAFLLAAGLLTITPGLDTALVLRTAAVEGRGAAWRAAIGIGAGCVAWGVIVALGAGAVLLASPCLYEALKLAGALYLAWLGLTMVVKAWAGGYALDLPDAPVAADRRWLVRGFLNNLLNPKVGLFYIAFLPQFVPAAVAPAPFMVLLALIHVALGLLWCAVLIAGVGRALALLRHPRVQGWMDGVTGAFFLAAGMALLNREI